MTSKHIDRNFDDFLTQGGLSEGLACHDILGQVEITNICIDLQKTNPDNTTLYVEHRGEIKEVSKRLVKHAE